MKPKEDKEAKAAEKAAAKAAAQEAKAARAAAKAKAKPKKKQTGALEFNFFMLHGEKLVAVAAVLIFAGMISGGSGLEKFTLTDAQITTSASNAEKTIAESKITPKEYDESLVPFDYDKYAGLIKSFVKVDNYETPNRWEQSLFPDKNKRPNVVPLPLENLRAVACVGAIQYKPLNANANANGAAGGMGGAMGGGMMGGGAMGGGMMGGGMGGGMLDGSSGGELKGRQWITVTGSIPIRKQQAAYGELFGNATYMDDVRDQPRYLYYELERGVADPASGNIEWTKIDVVKAIKKENQRWAGVGSDQVGYNYQAPVLSKFPPMAMTCPPMANKPFGEEIANLPNIPLNSSEQIEVQAEALEEYNRLQESMSQMDEATLLDRDPFEDAARGGAAAGGMGMGGMSGGMGGMGGMSGGMGSGGMGGGMEMGGTGGMGGMGGMNGAGGYSFMVNTEAAQASMLNAQAAVAVDYYLFRYFDFDVEPGKTYEYRVKLVLANPNYGVEERFVEDPTTLEQKNVRSDWCEPSNPVALGRVSRVFAENVEEASKPGLEPRVTISSIYFDEEDANESIVQGQRVVRGQVANFANQSHTPVAVSGSRGAAMGGMGSGGSGGMGMGMGMATASTGKKGKKKGGGKKTVDHISDVCVVDAEGGAKISGVDRRSPGKIMILEPNGLMQIREVKEDARELGRYDGSSGMGMGMGLGTGVGGAMM